MAFDFDPTSAKPVGAQTFEFDAASAKPAPTRSLARSAGDSAIALGSGVVQGAKMVTDVAGADNAASRSLGSATQALTDLESPYRKAQKQERATKIQAAEATGSTWEEVKAHVGAFAEAPLDTTLNALGTSAPTIAAAAIPGLGQAALATRAAQVGVGVAQGVGNIKGNLFDAVKQQHMAAGMPEAEASKRADAAQAYGGENAGSIALGGALGGLAGGTGVETAARNLLGRKLASEAAERAAPGVIRSAVGGALKEAPMEALQGGQERLASNTALQGEGFDVPTWQGVAGQAALEGLASAPMGGGFGAAEGLRARAQQRAAAQAAAGDPTAAWETQPGAADPNAPAAVQGPGPEAPDLQTEPGAAPARADGLDYQRDVDTSGLSLENPAEAERARRASMDYEPGDATPQWDTARGAAPERQPGLDMPSPDFDTAGLGLESRQRLPSQILGIDPAAGPLSRGAAMAVDAAPIQEAQFLGATGRDLQVRRSGPGVTDESRVIDVQGRVVEDRAIETSRRLTDQQDGMAARALGGDIAAQPPANRGSVPALPAPTNLRDAIARIRAQKQEAANAQAAQAPAPTAAPVPGPAAATAVEASGVDRLKLLSSLDQAGATREQVLNAKLKDAQDQLAQIAATTGILPADRASRISGINQDISSLNAVRDQARQLDERDRREGSTRSMLQGARQELDAAVRAGAITPEAAQAVASNARSTGNAADASEGIFAAVDSSTTGATSEPTSPQAIQASAQPSQAGPAQAEDAAAASASAPAPAGASAVRALSDGRATPANPGAKTAPAANPQGASQAAPSAIAGRPKNWRTSMLGAKPVAKSLGIETKGKRLAQVVAEIDATDATRAGVEQNGADLAAGQIDKDWSAFAQETGTLGVPRAEMPQIRSEHRGALVNFLKARGIDSRADEVPANDLKPTQAEFSPGKVRQAMRRAGSDRAILVSSDGYVVDGHHQWLAKRAAGEPVNVIRLKAPIRQVLQQVAEFPSSMRSEGAASTTMAPAKSAPELVAADAGVQSAGGEFSPQSKAAQQQTRPPASGPRQESDKNQPSAPVDIASAAIESGANPAAAGPRSARAAAPRPTTRIEDFGETLHGARKMLYAEAYADGMAKAKELDIKAHPLSKTWPEPDYQKLLEGGAPLEAVSLVRALREAVPNKPQSSWKLKGWSTQVETLRGFAEDVLSGQQEPSAVRVKLNRDSMPRGVADKVALYEAMGHERSLKGIDVSVGRYSMYDRVEYNPPRTIWSVSREAKGGAFANWPRELAKGDTREEAIEAFKKRATELLAEERAPTKGATFEIYGKRAGGAREFFIGKKIGRNVAELKAGFPDIKAARKYLADNQAELEGLLDKYKAVPPVRNDQNAPRIGEDYRKGADVTPEQFQEAFGFRGVQFGNYVEGGRRQQDLNRAYDALMDLAGVLNLPPRALSLGGRLGLAFGARGTGGTDAAAAHYERGNVVINLTKREGAGSLAHEWWHGLDNYFSRQRGEGDGYMTVESQSGSGVREEMRAAFREVNAAINRTRMQERSRKLDDRKTKDYWTTKPEMSARAFESYVISKLQDQNAGNDYLANVLPASVFALEGGYPYPTAGEMPQIRGAFDAFFQAVETREEGGATVLYSTSDSAPPARGLSLEQAQQAVQQALAGLRNPPPVHVVSRGEELGVGTPDGVMGAAIPAEGRIVLVASAHGSADAVIETVFHESFHLGIRNVLPAADYVQTMLDLAKRDSRVQEYANRWKKEASDAPQQLQALRDQGHTGSELTAQYEALAIEEGLAVVAEELRAQKQAGTRLGMRVRVLANWLASVAERMGMGGLAERIRKMTYNEAERFVLRAIEHAGQAPIRQDDSGAPRYRTADQTATPAFQRWFGESQVVGAAGQPLRVFHGTGGDFSVFSRARAGAVTGAANTGMGFFFTDNAEVAWNYARMSRDAQAIMPVYLSLQNPLQLQAKNMMEADKLLLAGLKPQNDGAIIQVAMRDGGTQTVYMVREPGQIKSATGNQGTFDPGNPDIRYRTRDENPLAQRIGAAIQGATVTNLKQQAGFKATDYRGLGLQLLGRRQLVDVYGSMLPEMRSYSDLMARMDADKNEAGSGADQLAQDWAKLPDERALAELMHDATLAQIDPSKDFVEGDNKTDWTRLKARYTALTPGAKDVFARARDTYRQHMRDVRSAIKERIERTEISSERKASMLKRMDDEFFGHIKGVYFPLARFGQYLVVVKDAEGKVANVSRAETMAEADATRRQLVGAFPAAKGFTVGKVLKAKDFVAERDSVGRGFMEQLYGVLDKQGMDTKQRAELEDALGQLYLSSLPDLSWAKHGIHRKGTAGFSQDARRAFAQNVFHGASYLAKLRYGDRLQDELGEMQRRVDAGVADANFDSVKAQQVVDEMVKRHEAAMNPKTNAVSTALTSLGFMFHLGLSPASAMVNLTQTALVAYPVMAAKWGFGKASTALLKASGEAARGKNDITGSLSAEEKAAFDEAVRAGVIDVTMAHDLAGIAQGEDQNVSYKLRPVMRAASWMFHHAEKFNRQITFVAAYRLAREAGAGDKAAYEQAVQATYDGHFDYSSNNRPRVMQGNVARVVLLFKQYGQNMVYTLVRNAQQSLKGATPEDRAQARKALGGLLVMYGLAAGALGLPMVTTLLAAASMLGGDDDEPWDAQVALQNMLADTFGQKAAEVLAHGLSRLTPWDISGRVGLDKLIFPDLQEGLEGQRLGESAMAAALGPVAGIGINLLKGIQEMGEGRYLRGLETMAPSVARGPLKAWRYGDEGVRDKTGIVVQDEVGAAELLGQASGFSPSSVRNSFEGKSAIVQHDRALQARRSALVEQFAMAAMAGDEEGKAAAREDIAKFNEKNPNRRIQAMQLAQSVAQRQKRIREAQEGVYLPSKRRDALEAGRFAVAD